MTQTFVASRISGNGNAIFPDKLTIDDDKVTYYKGKNSHAPTPNRFWNYCHK